MSGPHALAFSVFSLVVAVVSLIWCQWSWFRVRRSSAELEAMIAAMRLPEDAPTYGEAGYRETPARRCDCIEIDPPERHARVCLGGRS